MLLQNDTARTLDLVDLKDGELHSLPSVCLRVRKTNCDLRPCENVVDTSLDRSFGTALSSSVTAVEYGPTENARVKSAKALTARNTRESRARKPLVWDLPKCFRHIFARDDVVNKGDSLALLLKIG